MRPAEMQEIPHAFLGMAAVIASPEMRQVIRLVERAARTNAVVLVTGETGAGKEIVARAVHHYSLRSARAWVDFNCAALPEHLVESELFGYEKGAFSGADRMKSGLFELADTGTLFLDEVGELEPRVQARMLRVLDGVPYYRVGGQKKVTVDVRVVAATNRDLEAESRAGRFRSDLFYRLNQCTIRVPPLRERRADILPLASHFLAQIDAEREFNEDAKIVLERYSWPGNVRELRNVVTRAAIDAESRVIGATALGLDLSARAKGPGRIARAYAAAEPTTDAAPDDAMYDVAETAVVDAAEPQHLEALERRAILAALKNTGGHHQRTADLLGISVRTLSRKLRSYIQQAPERPVAQRSVMESSYYAR